MVDVLVHADDHRLARIDGDLGAVGRFLDLPLDEPGLDRRQRSAHSIDPLEELDRSLLDLIGQLFDRERAGDRVDRIRGAGLRRDDLLRAERQPRRFLGWQGQRLVAAVAVERLGAAEDRRHRLDGDPDDVVVGLLGGEGAARGLGMEPQLQRAGVGGPESVAHEARPQAPGRAELRDLFQEVVMGVEEEREPLAKLVHVEARVDRRAHVGDGVREREGHFLHRGRTSLPDVIPADRDAVPVRQLVRTEREDVGDDAQRGSRG